MKIVCAEPLGVSQAVMEEFAAKLRGMGHEFTAYPDRNEDPDVLAARIGDADAVIITNQPLRENVLCRCPCLSYVNVAFTGVDHLDTAYCQAHDIAVSNASGYSDTAVAELAFGMMLSLCRFLPACDKAVREGKTKAGLIGGELCGKTVGIIGCGKIGGRVAELALAFGCRVLGFSRSEKPALAAKGVTFVPLEELMAKSDIITLHLPQNPSTQKLIGKELIGMMKPSAIFINTARGPIVDSEALAEALNSGRIAGAAIDVFETEPPIAESHPLLHSKNTLLTPHVAFATGEAMERRAEIVFDNTLCWLHGEIKNQIV